VLSVLLRFAPGIRICDTAASGPAFLLMTLISLIA
jgi:hypothetical protein